MKYNDDIEPNIKRVVAFVEESELIPNEFKEDIYCLFVTDWTICEKSKFKSS